jgi:Tfp pilus assembly protein PilO
MDLSPLPLARLRLAICLLSTALFLVLGYAAKLPRTQRHYEGVAAAGV